MATPEPLHRTLQSVTFTDTEINRIAHNAAREAERIMNQLAKSDTISAKVRSAQIALAKTNAAMWTSVGHATTVGIGDAVWGATEAQALFDESLFAKAGHGTPTWWRASQIATAKEGMDNLISRKQNGFTLSQKVYHNTALSKGWVDDAINTGLALGKSVAEITNDVVGFIDPATPGGASFAAKRLARTEVINAYHATSVRKYQQTPWVERVKWNLSGSHAKPDQCNEYAEHSHIPGGEAGMFFPFDVPDKPHPNCLCYVTPEVMDLDRFAKNFSAGKYDSYLGDVGCYRGA